MFGLLAVPTKKRLQTFFDTVSSHLDHLRLALWYFPQTKFRCAHKNVEKMSQNKGLHYTEIVKKKKLNFVLTY